MVQEDEGSPIDRLAARIGARTLDESQDAGTPKREDKPLTQEEPGQQQLSAYERFIQRFVTPSDKSESGDKPGEQEPGQQPGEVKFIEVDNPELVPSSPDGYTISVEGADPKLTTFLTQTAHELKMTRSQTNILAQKYDSLVKATLAEAAQKSELTTQAINGELKTVWGTEFEANSKAVHEFTRNMSDAQFTATVQRLLHAEATKQR